MAALSDRWDRVLWSKPQIRYFSMREATQLTGEFRHWRPEARDEKLRALIDSIDTDKLTAICCLVHLEWFEKTFGPLAVRLNGAADFSQPYLLGLKTVLSASCREAYDQGCRSRVEVIFDEHDVFSQKAKKTYPVLREMAPPELQPLMPLEPWFRDDKDEKFIPLQAADLIAGEMRLATVGDEFDWMSKRFEKLRFSKYSIVLNGPLLRELANEITVLLDDRND